MSAGEFELDVVERVLRFFLPAVIIMRSLYLWGLPSLTNSWMILILSLALSLVPLFLKTRISFLPAVIALLLLIFIESESGRVDQNLFPLTLMMISFFLQGKKSSAKARLFAMRLTLLTPYFLAGIWKIRSLFEGESVFLFLPRALAINFWEGRSVSAELARFFYAHQNIAAGIAILGILTQLCTPIFLTMNRVLLSFVLIFCFQLCVMVFFQIFHVSSLLCLLITFLVPRIMLQYRKKTLMTTVKMP